MMDLKTTKGMTVACGLPLHQQGNGEAMALFTGWMLHCCLKQGSKGHGGRVAAVIDEMAGLGAGPSKQWLDAFANGAGAGGLSIIGVYQDLNQIAVQMGREAVGTILQNCEATLYWGVADGQTRKKVSELAGTREVISESKSVNWRGGDPNVSGTKTVRTVPLIQPHEVGAVGGDKRDTRMISFVRGLPPIMGHRKPYTQMESGYGKKSLLQRGMVRWLTSRNSQTKRRRPSQPGVSQDLSRNGKRALHSTRKRRKPGPNGAAAPGVDVLDKEATV